MATDNGDQYRVLSEQGQKMSGRRSRSRSPQANRRMSRSRSPRDRGGRGPATAAAGDNSGKKLRVYVRNLPYETRWMELKDAMKKCGNVEHAEVFTDSDGKSKGCGVVEFSRAEDAERAIKELDGSEIGQGDRKRQIRCREDIMDDETYKKQLQNLKEKSRAMKDQQQGGGGGHQHMQHQQHQHMDRGGGGGVDSLLQRETYKQQMFNILNNKNPDPVNCSVFVSNLDYEVNWQTLKDVFRRAGTCVRCDIQQDQDKKSKGFGTVVFETPFEALVAIAIYHQAPIGKAERLMACRLDRSAPLTLMMNNLSIEYQKFTCAQLVQLQAQATLSLTQASSLGGLAGGLGGLAGYGLAQQAGGLNLAQLLSANLGQSALAGAGLAGSGGLGASAGLVNSGMGSATSGFASNLNSSFGQSQNSHSRGDDRRNSVGRRGGEGGPRGGEGGPGCKIFVSNLPWSMTWQQLKDKAKSSGNVVRADIQEDKATGRSRGMGTVEFETAEEAQRAIRNLHMSTIDSREIKAKLDGEDRQTRDRASRWDN